MPINKEFKKKNGKVNIDKWAKKYMKTVPWGNTVTGGLGEAKPAKVMSNEDRRKLGVEQDESLDDYLPNKENK